MSILIIDDDAEYLDYMSKALSAAGYKHLTASTGAAARRIIERERLSLLITDLRIPDVSGMELMGLARQIDPLTVCIAMTAFASVDSAMEALRFGAYDYLLKPSGLDVIHATVRRGLEHYDLRQTLIERTTQMEKFKTESVRALGLIREVSKVLSDPLNIVCSASSHLSQKIAEQTTPRELRDSVRLIQENAEIMRGVLEALAARRIDAAKTGDPRTASPSVMQKLDWKDIEFKTDEDKPKY